MNSLKGLTAESIRQRTIAEYENTVHTLIFAKLGNAIGLKGVVEVETPNNSLLSDEAQKSVINSTLAILRENGFTALVRPKTPSTIELLAEPGNQGINCYYGSIIKISW